MPLKYNFNLKGGCVSVRDILDPKEVHGEYFPGEPVRVLEEKEVRLYGDALRRTSRLVLAAWDGQGQG